MTRTLTALMAVGMLAVAGLPAAAVDGHGNAERPELAAPNKGGVSGGPSHRDDPREMKARKGDGGGKAAHSADDGHGHGKK